MEGAFAYFLESAFLGIFLFGERRFGQRVHWFSALMVFLGTWASGYFILATNAWMQNPVGYEEVAGGGVRISDYWAVASVVVPRAKLIVLLRNPVDRAYSDYQHKFRAGFEALSFEEALEAEEERIAGEVEKILSDVTYHSRNYRRYSYRSRGVYVDQLQEWHRYFHPRQFLVIKSENYFADPLKVLRSIYRFLALPEYVPEVGPSARVRNSASYEPMAPSTRGQLEAFFEPHNRRLY